MGILSTDSAAGPELGMDVGDAKGQTAQIGPTHPSAGNTKGITQKPATYPEIRNRSSRSLVNPKMVDLEPSVRFDLAPRLDLEVDQV